jgi:cell division protein FtsL
MKILRAGLILWIAAVIGVPAALYLNVRQAYRFDILRREIGEARREQNSLFEANKRAIAGISGLSSPARITRIAEEELGLTRFESHRIITIRMGPDSRNEKN